VLFAGGGVVAAAAAVALRTRPQLAALLSIGVALALGLAAYSGDRAMTRTTLRSLAPAHPHWLDRSRIHADVLVLPGASLHAGWVLESWNRNAGRTFHLGDLPTDPLPHTKLGIGPDGTLSDGRGAAFASRHLVVAEWGSRIELASGVRIAAPLRGLGLYRTSGPLRLRSFADGLYADGWARSILRYRAFRARRTAGAYRVTLALPAGRPARRVDLEAGPERQRIELVPGSSTTVRIPATGHPLPELAIRANRADFVGAGTPRPRLVGFRVSGLEFVPAKRSRN
jgi:hypothetical protein